MPSKYRMNVRRMSSQYDPNKVGYTRITKVKTKGSNEVI